MATAESADDSTRSRIELLVVERDRERARAEKAERELAELRARSAVK